MEIEQLQKLIAKYNSGKASLQEQALLEEWYESIQGSAVDMEPTHLATLKGELKKGVHAVVLEDNDTQVSPYFNKKRIWRNASWAAILLMGIGISMYLYTSPSIHKSETTASKSKVAINMQNDIAPGGNLATLTLADGNTIALNDINNGVLLEDNQVNIKKTGDGELVYQSTISNIDIEAKINTLSTPRGGQFNLTLADGTKVWLNSVSTLTFPATFSGKERVVELTGEAYFEVAHNANMPFHVKMKNSDIEVLGTHFNVKEYSDQQGMKATLLEGSVKVTSSNDGQSKTLIPGQQARINKNYKFDIVEADVEHTIAWKNGYFQFNRESLREVMRQFSRWYDIEVVYEGVIPKDQFVGKIRRALKLSEALKILKISQVDFRIEGRTIYISGNKDNNLI